MKCIECEKGKATKDDPRIPPLDTDKCLCVDCWKSAVDERICELEDKIGDLNGELEELLKLEKKSPPRDQKRSR